MPKGVYTHKKASIETRLKMSEAHKGIIFSAERNHKISISRIGNNFGAGNKGKKHTPENIEKQRESHRGSKTNLWKGGISSAPGYKSYHSRKRRAIKVLAVGEFSAKEWEALKIQYNFTCPSCNKKEPEIKLTADHIVPLIKKGDNDISNIQPLCGSCNSRKGVKIIKYDRPMA